MTSVTTVVQEDEGSTSSVSGIYGGACIECPAGNACPGGGVVEECSAGTFSAGGSATTVCRPCEPGTFASTNGTEACELCAPGAFFRARGDEGGGESKGEGGVVINTQSTAFAAQNT